MTNEELIATLRGENYFVTLLHDAADALEAADKRIAELEAQLPKDGEWMVYAPVNNGWFCADGERR